jgi:ubiquinone/menaquinone biosynthesis C-methylase UbiE
MSSHQQTVNDTATPERWRRSISGEQADWDASAWLAMPAARRRSEWCRHLEELGLSLDGFRGQRVLEVGCGPTGIVYFIDAERRVGLDPLGDFYARWNGHFGPPIELVSAKAEAMPFDSASFDTVFCTNCLDHTEDAPAVLAEIARVLRPSGLLVVHVDLDSPLRKLHKLVKPRTAGALHPLSLSYGWLRSQLEQNFDVLQEHRDPEVFRLTRSQIRYEAYWDGLMYRLTRGAPMWINHAWMKAARRSGSGQAGT